MHRCSRRKCFIKHSSALLLLLISLGPASATGFFVNQQSVRGLGRADAGNSVAADDLGTIFFNAAGLTQLWKDGGQEDWRWSLTTNVIAPRSELIDKGSTVASPGTLGATVAYGGGNAEDPVSTAAIPNLYVTHRISERAAIGAAVNAPFGLETIPGTAWFGRYDTAKARLATVNIGLVGAYEIIPNSLSIGGGLDVQFAETTLDNAIPNPIAPGSVSPATDGFAESMGHAWTPGFNVGLLYTFPSGRTRIGAHYRSGLTHSLEGSVTVQGLSGPLAAANGRVTSKADLNLPAIATLGIWHQLSAVTLMAEFEWDGWSAFDEIRIRFANGQPDQVRPEHYRDAYSIALGLEYPWPGQPISLRGGIHYDTTPTVDSYRDSTVPDAERVWLGIGATYDISRRWSVDFAYNHVFFRDTTLGITRSFFDTPATAPLTTVVRIAAVAKMDINVAGLAIHYRY